MAVIEIFEIKKGGSTLSNSSLQNLSCCSRYFVTVARIETTVEAVRATATEIFILSAIASRTLIDVDSLVYFLYIFKCSKLLPFLTLSLFI